MALGLEVALALALEPKRQCRAQCHTLSLLVHVHRALRTGLLCQHGQPSLQL